MKDKIREFREFQRKINAFEYALWLMNWDQSTETPTGSLSYKTEQTYILTNEKYEIESNQEYLKIIGELVLNEDKLSLEFAREIKLVQKDLRVIKFVPKLEYLNHEVLKSTASAVWEKARREDDFQIFLPVLERIVDFQIKIAKYLETDELKGYDIFLDYYEEGMTTASYDRMFSELKKELVPFVMYSTTLNKRKFHRRLTSGHYPIADQKEFTEYLLDVFNFDRKKGTYGFSNANSYTTSVTSTDVRMAVKYDESNIKNFIFSVIHEIGHAIYDQQSNPKYDQTRLFGGASKGIHESQSRLYENLIGKSFEFWEVHYKKLEDVFPKQLKNIPVEEFHAFLNHAERSLIRKDADELTYPLHTLVYYEIERDLISGRLKPKNLPNRFKSLMTKYVGKRPVKDSEGVLQDIHWSTGAFGYFPTYALGSILSVQIYDKMNLDVNIKNAIKNNDIKSINEWLGVNIHQYGASLTPEELLKKVLNEDFNTKPYIEYLKDKYKYE